MFKQFLLRKYDPSIRGKTLNKERKLYAKSPTQWIEHHFRFGFGIFSINIERYNSIGPMTDHNNDPSNMAQVTIYVRPMTIFRRRAFELHVLETTLVVLKQGPE